MLRQQDLGPYKTPSNQKMCNKITLIFASNSSFLKEGTTIIGDLANCSVESLDNGIEEAVKSVPMVFHPTPLNPELDSPNSW